MASQSEVLQQMLDAIKAMQEARYTHEDIEELVAAAFEHLKAEGHQPYAFERCTECGRVIIGWSAYQWSILVRKPCPRCGKPW